MNRATLRLVPVAAGAWASAFAATVLPAESAALALALWTLTLVALVSGSSLCRRRRPPHRRLGTRGRRAVAVAALTLAVGAGAASHVAMAQPQRSEASRLALDGGRSLTMRADVVGKIERRASGEWEFDAVATRLITGPVRAAVHIDVTVRVAPDHVSDPALLDVGAAVEVRGTARAAPPGARAVWAVTGTRGVAVLHGPEGPAAVASALRRGLVGAADGLPPPGAGLIPGLAVGDTSAVDPELDAAMKASSLSHLTAVSGANCAIVVGLAFLVAAGLGASRTARVAAGTAALGGFVLLVTPEPSVARAAGMSLIAMLAVLLGRTGAGMSILSLAVAILLIGDPWLSSSLGFALSSVATASLLLCARPLAAGMARRLPKALALALSVPLAAQLACGPLLIMISPTVPLYGVAANLLAAPAAPVATILGLAACLAAPAPALQAGLAVIAWLPAAWIAATAQVFADMPGGQLPWLEGALGVLTLSMVSVSVLVLAIPVARRRRTIRPMRRTRSGWAPRIAAALVLAVTAGVAAGGALLGSVAGPLTLPASWSVVACDVGQGDAVLVRSAGAVALIDTGPDPQRLDRCLARTGVDRIDLLVLTHFDLDHAGGVDAVVGKVGTTLHGVVGTAAGSRALRELARSGSRLVPAHLGQSGLLGDTRWRVLWPPPATPAFPPGNDLSVVLEVRGGGMPASVFLGDLSRAPQIALTASGVLRPPYEIVKVAHHGSADQYPELYEELRPIVAVISVGADNTYGHPRAEVLTLLGGLDARIARTDGQGLIALWRDEDGLEVWRERSGDVAPAR